MNSRFLFNKVFNLKRNCFLRKTNPPKSLYRMPLLCLHLYNFLLISALYLTEFLEHEKIFV